MSRLLTFEEIKENRETVVPKISEGCETLEKIINQCIELNIPTIACCAGHNITDRPYITMRYSNETRKYINGFLNKIGKLKNIDVMFAATGISYHPFHVTIYTKYSNRDAIFGIIGQCLEARLQDEHLTPDFELGLNIAITMDYKLARATVDIINTPLGRKYLIGVGGELDKDSIFYEHKQGYSHNPMVNMTYYKYKNKEKLQQVYDDIIGLRNIYKLGNFEIPSNASANEKVDRIHEFNEIYENLTGSITRKF